MERTKKSIALGSGFTYLTEFTGELPSVSELVAACTEENKLGETKGGATLTYTATTHEEKDDFGLVMRVITTEEEAKLKTGLFTWAIGTLPKLVSTGRMSTDGEYNVLRIGGLDNDDGKRYVVIFRHVDKLYGDLYVIIVGTNTAGLSIAFARDSASKLEPEFTAIPQDDAGTLILIAEKKPSAAGQENG